MPDTSQIKAYPISQYTTTTTAGAAIIHMIMNNLDRRVAQFPEELVTYGGNGQVGVGSGKTKGPVGLWLHQTFGLHFI